MPTEPAIQRGMVYLVGAGPGDPGLLTVRALELLRAAEVVAYDKLVSQSILSLVRHGTELLPVGRRHGTGATSYRLHPEVLVRAKAGRMVVRLKAGDPFIFGRGGEEAEELADAGIPYSIVPGVSAALGAAAYAGIPLTHRQHASEVTFMSGHDVDRNRDRVTDWSKAASGTGTVVLFMTARKLAASLHRLIQGGRSAEMPAAYIASATMPNQQVIVGTLSSLGEKTRHVDVTTPALVIVGDVVALRERLAWFERRPLIGRRLLVARARPGRSLLAAYLRALGAEVLEMPEVEVVPFEGGVPIQAALARLHEFSGIVFGCAAGVDAVVTHALAFNVPVIAVGNPAAQALSRHGIPCSLFVRDARQEAFSQHAMSLQKRRFLLVTAEGGRPHLQQELRAIGAEVETVSAYRCVQRMPRGNMPPIDLVVLPSSSAAKAVLAADISEHVKRVPMAAIGPQTEAAARQFGALSVVRAEKDTMASVVSLMIEMVGKT